MPPESTDASSKPTPAATVAPAAKPAAPTHHITQHLLSSDGPSTVTLPDGSRLLDVHMIDGRYVLRAVEPIEHDDPTDSVQIVPAALGSKILLAGLMPLVVRSGGIHFFTSAYEV